LAEPTMREAYLKDQLGKHGIETIVPDSDADLTQIFEYIMDELGVNVFKDETRAFFVAQVERLASHGCEGVILGCTEIELLELHPHTGALLRIFS
jgi:aspartate racemase